MSFTSSAAIQSSLPPSIDPELFFGKQPELRELEENCWLANPKMSPSQKRTADSICISWLAERSQIQIRGWLRYREKKDERPGGIQISRLKNKPKSWRSFQGSRACGLGAHLLLSPHPAARGYVKIAHEWNDCWHKENDFFALAPLYGQWIMKCCDPSWVLRPQ